MTELPSMHTISAFAVSQESSNLKAELASILGDESSLEDRKAGQTLGEQSLP